ncbi:hypothetical protein Afil01_38630 [Actinorhabdospora filicis]|uniref:Uncharacterized protein n=1 Tax=Actinorhabdospora filicis TaxID=1785913 RepID=A0A9W6WAY5_9ACTN|nr:hypothetical protein [Actinorhabdospora filicis]GLZ79056.1 hypothetical protein Afil01_38630 [Actinorhabdospora filicis]
MAEPIAGPRRRRPGVLLAVILGAIAVVAAGVVVVVLLLPGGCGDDDHVTDRASGLCYPIPGGWEKAADGGLAAPESAGAGSFMLAPTPEFLASPYEAREETVLGIAKGLAENGNSRAELAVDTESSKSLTVSGHDAVTSSVRYNYVGVPDYRYLRVTAVRVADTWAILVAMGADGDKAAVDEIHDGLTVVG